jgi:hypothetical protein
MKDKRTSNGTTNSPEKYNNNNNTSNSYTKFKKQIRRTLGSDEDNDKITWNISVSKLSPFWSPPKNKSQFDELKSVV